MKRLFAFAAVFMLVALAGATLNVVKANPSTARDTLDDASATPTITPTSTDEICAPPPPAPELLAPAHQAVFEEKTLIKLRWSTVECANKYRILVRRDSRTGEPVARGHTQKTKAFVQLEPGHSYFWNIKACINKQCRRSNTKKFTLVAPPTPTPTLTPTPTVTPTRTPTRRNTSAPPTQQAGTPVPGNPPSSLNDYKGPSVYLSDQPSPLFYYDCSFKWGDFRKGSNIYTVTLWFYPNESVKFQLLDFNLAQVVQTGTYRANSEGYLSITFDTSSWVPDHYHLLFNSQSSHIEYCGHLQVFADAAGGTGQEHAPHTPEEIERVNRKAGIEP